MKFNSVALFCDDIREEASGTQSLMGIWSDYVVLQAGPDGVGATVRMALYVRTLVPVEQVPEAITITLFAGENVVSTLDLDVELVANTLSQAVQGGVPNAGFINRVLAPNFPIFEPVLLRVVAKSGETEQVVGAALLSFISPTALPPPSSQSPLDAPAS